MIIARAIAATVMDTHVHCFSVGPVGMLRS